MTNRAFLCLGVLVAATGLAGCGGGSGPAAGPERAYLADTEPAGAVDVGQARKSAVDQEDVVLVGRIGGSASPFVQGLAAFTIVDLAVPHCTAEEGCPTPWDYCCEQDQVKKSIATVKIVDAAGQPLARDARELLGVKELSTVVVRGKAQRDAQGNLSVLASQVFVK